MPELTIGQAAELRNRFDSLQMCSIIMADHDFVHVLFEGVIVAVLCSKCGRYPLEVMSFWEVGPEGVN